jgi:hypothetical protein
MEFFYTSNVLQYEHFVCRASRDHKPLGLWVIVSHAQSQLAYHICIVSVRDSVVITCVRKAFFYFVFKRSDCSLLTVLRQWRQWRKVEKEGGKKKEMITVEVKNGSVSRATARGYGDIVWRLRRRRKRLKHPSLKMRLGRRQKQVSLDHFLVKVALKEDESTDSSDSVSDNESRTQ